MKFIVWSPAYRDNSGGIIVLHKLLSILKEQGHQALLWPQRKPSIYELKDFKGLVKLVKWYGFLIKSKMKGEDIRSPYQIALATSKDIKGAVVVYPEITVGNPLGASRVVRWLLSLPGERTGIIEFGNDDVFFYYNEHFNDWGLNPHPERKLNVVEPLSSLYFPPVVNDDRSGQCYIIRKGKNRPHDYHEENAIGVDGLSHEEMANIFRKSKYFISYDLYTMYSRYAAMCGCIPVVVPEPGLSEEKWRPEIDKRYGVAYGWEGVPWAIETRDLLLEAIKKSDIDSDNSVHNFVRIIEDVFF